MADKRLIPEGIRDISTEALNELIDSLGTLDLTPLLIYIIDNVHASALPHLAEQFHIMGEGWGLAHSDAEKRALIKKAIELHRHKGTRWAIEEVLRALNIDGRVFEWFEDVPYPYNIVISLSGEQYKFSILILLEKMFGDNSFGAEVQQELRSLIEQYKNVRSHLDDIVVGAKWHAVRGLAGGLMTPCDIRRQELKTESAYQMNNSIGMAGGLIGNISANEIYMEAI